MKRIAIEYFAQLRDERGAPSESLETDAATAAELYAEVARAHGFTLPRESLRVAVNRSFAPWHTALDSGDVVVFLPPAAGG